MAFRNINQDYKFSFSGSDAVAFAYFEGSESDVIQLETMHTISVSVYEAKGDARSLGFKGVKGFAKSVRTIAGTAIFTAVEDNPLRKLFDMLREVEKSRGHYYGGWSFDQLNIGVGTAIDQTEYTNRLATLLPSFNILIQYVNEGATYGLWGLDGEMFIEGAAILLRGVEFISEGMTTSVNDSNTEVVLQYKAIDFKPLSAQNLKQVLKSGFITADEEKEARLANAVNSKFVPQTYILDPLAIPVEQ